jgi:predicted DNA-binding protein with PD1-like motif
MSKTEKPVSTIKMEGLMRSIFLAAILVVGAASTVYGQAPEPPLPPNYATSPELHDGMAPGMKATELSPKVRIFRLVFAKGDDVASGLAEFAKKNHLTDAHFSAIGAFGAAVIGWSDRPMKSFKVVRLNEEMEVSAFNGSITRDKDGKPVVHAHCVVGLLRNGAVYAGHCQHEEVSLTMQLYLTDSEPLPTTN